jgi:hypothetical protein
VVISSRANLDLGYPPTVILRKRTVDPLAPPRLVRQRAVVDYDDYLRQLNSTNNDDVEG